MLNDRQAAELTRLGEQIEALYGVPMDVEWAMPGTEADAHFAILQARPITVLPPAPAEPLDWPLPKLGGKYARASIIELHSLPPAIRQRLSAMSPINYPGHPRFGVSLPARRARRARRSALHRVHRLQAPGRSISVAAGTRCTSYGGAPHACSLRWADQHQEPGRRCP